MTKLINDYVAASFLTHEIAKNMLERLELVILQPNIIVDLGCGVGHGAELLKKNYKNTQIVAIDSAEMLLRYGQKNVKEVTWVCADTGMLPLFDCSVDLVFANLLLPWFDNVKDFLQECKRILRPQGLLMFSCLGPDTLIELRKDFPDQIVPHLLDMHDMGDALVQAGFADPVLDVEVLTITYREIKTLLSELQLTGMLMDDVTDIQLEPNSEGIVSITYEIVYGHAWVAEGYKADEEGVVKFPLAHLRGRKTHTANK